MHLHDSDPVDESLLDNLRMIVGGVATIAGIVIPFILIRKLVKTIEQSDRFKAIENVLS